MGSMHCHFKSALQKIEPLQYFKDESGDYADER